MKALKFIVIGVLLSMAIPTQAQISVHPNLGTPPQWGPVGYSQARYYYLPDVEAYYDVQSSMFIYMSGGAWVHRAYLPERYRDYDPVSYTHLRAHETGRNLVCRLLLEKKK